MLQVARLAPRQLGESRDLVAAFLRGQLESGRRLSGSRRRQRSLLHRLRTRFARRASGGSARRPDVVPTSRRSATSTRSTSSIWPVWRARGRHSAVSLPPDSRTISWRASKPVEARTAGTRPRPAPRTAVRTPRFSRSGRIRTSAGRCPASDKLLESLRRLRAADGSYANFPGLPSGTTTATAAAVLVMRQLNANADRDAGMWLLDRCHARGGFFASRSTPVPDLLSTATALHALVRPARSDRRPLRSMPRFRRLALDESRRLLRAPGQTMRSTASTRITRCSLWGT